MINKNMKSVFLIGFIFASTSIFANGKESDSSDENPTPDTLECQPFPECTQSGLEIINSQSSIWSILEGKPITQINAETYKLRSPK